MDWLASWIGRARVAFTTAPDCLPLQLKGGGSTTLQQLCEDSTPACWLNPFLFNGHLQTIYTAVKEEGPKIYYKRKIFNQEDPTYEGTFAVDFVVKPNAEKADESLPPRTTYFGDDGFDGIASLDTKPMLIALHGLSGGSYEIYLRQVLVPLIADGKWEACVVNSRGCAMHNITTTVLYNARATWDLRQIVKWARKTFPNRPLFGIGFSLGANMMTNYIGEEGSNCLLTGAVVISSPWNPDVSHHGLTRTWIGREIYSKAMGGNMKRLYERHQEMINRNPLIDPEKIRRVKYLHEFDQEIQCPTWGYPTYSAYYRDSSSVDSLLDVRIPFLAINAVDDPIVTHQVLPYPEFELNPYAVLCTTSMGGHLSWFELGGTRWHARPTCNFLNSMAFKVDHSSLKAPNINGAAEVSQDARRRKHDFDAMRRRLQTRSLEYGNP